MAQKDARIRFLERELAEREKEMETMKEYDQPPVPEVEDERLRDLERKVRELEAREQPPVSEARGERLEAGEERLRNLERKMQELEGYDQPPVSGARDERLEAAEEHLRNLERKVRDLEDEQPAVSEATEERLEAAEEHLRSLERKVRELEALVKGLMEEVLDVKSVAMKLSRDGEERRKKPAVAEERRAGATLQSEPRATAESRPVHAPEPRAPVRPVEKRQPAHQPAPVPDDVDMELIMQNDGTLKPEPRRPSEYIVASPKFAGAPAKARGKGGKSPERTLFVEQKKRPVDDVIHAEEGDTVDLDR
ncbi:hypothetical protein [Methanoculleus sp.]|jgi:myosin heavy subunit|uniref:hypothetical protein n=1 Tax=Methanoculleus sp. TaxID=90427 RepID=UPI0025D0254A|nr:hypothetical protein [Methanoculleus sp.]